jgi:hypothetical protein
MNCNCVLCVCIRGYVHGTVYCLNSFKDGRTHACARARTHTHTCIHSFQVPANWHYQTTHSPYQSICKMVYSTKSATQYCTRGETTSSAITYDRTVMQFIQLQVAINTINVVTITHTGNKKSIQITKNYNECYCTITCCNYGSAAHILGARMPRQLNTTTCNICGSLVCTLPPIILLAPRISGCLPHFWKSCVHLM